MTRPIKALPSAYARIPLAGRASALWRHLGLHELGPMVALLSVSLLGYGFFALAFVTPTLLQDLLNLNVGFTNALSAGLVLGVMIIPTIASLAEDSLTAVPRALRQGSLVVNSSQGGGSKDTWVVG